MITAGEFRKGITVEIDGNVYIIVDFLHVKPGKGAAFVRTKIKNVMTGQVLERTFNPNEKYPLAHIERKEMQYLYNDEGLYYFMDNETYEQIALDKESVDAALPYLKDNLEVTIKFYKGAAFSVEPPNFVEFEIIDAEPGVKGDTATNVTKQATIETGYKVAVPLFVNVGDRIRIDTRSGEYMDRV